MNTTHTLRNVLTAWSVLSVAVLLLLLTYHSDNARFFGRYSGEYFVIVLGVAALTAFSVVLAVLGRHGKLDFLTRLEPRLSPQAVWGVVALTLAGVMVWWLVSPGVVVGYHFNVLRLYVTISVLGAVSLVVYVGASALPEVPNRVFVGLGILSLLVVLVLAVVFIQRVPAIEIYDEGLLADAALNCATSGKPVSRILPPLNQMSQVITVPLVFCLHGHAMKLTAVTLEVARGVNLGLMLLAAPLMFWLARFWYGFVPAVAATMALIGLALLHTYVRGEVFVVLPVTLALLAYTISFQTNNWRWDFVAGSALVLALIGHQLSAQFIPAFGLVYLWDAWQARGSQRRWWLNSRLWAFVAGLGVGGLIYYYVHVVLLAETDVFGLLQMVQQRYALEGEIGGRISGIERFFAGLNRWHTHQVVRHPLEVMWLALGIGAALLRPAPFEKRLLFLLITSNVVLFFVNPKPTINPYLVHSLPFMAVFAAVFFHRVLSAERYRVIAVLWIATFIGLSAANHLRHERLTTSRLLEVGYEIDQALSPNVQTIIADPIYFFGLVNRTMYDSTLFFSEPVLDVIEAWEMKVPEAVALTFGYSDSSFLLAYIRDQGMVEVARFEHDQFQRVTVLYVLPEFAAFVSK